MKYGLSQILSGGFMGSQISAPIKIPIGNPIIKVIRIIIGANEPVSTHDPLPQTWHCETALPDGGLIQFMNT